MDKIQVLSAAGFSEGDIIRINPGETNEEDATIVGFGSILVAAPLKFEHQAGEKVLRVAAANVLGDVDCDGDVDSVDSLKELRFVAGLTVSQTEPCPDIGSELTIVFGDLDCGGDVDSVDSLKALLHIAGLSVSQTEPCPDIGDAVAITELTVDLDSQSASSKPFVPVVGMALLGLGGLLGISRRFGHK